MWRILPYLCLLYLIAHLDRINVGYAALEMTKDLGFTASIYGFGAGIFFFGYFLLEIPGTVLVETWSARGWIARIMISWGILSSLTGFIHTPTQFYWARFLLGLAEAGFFPGMIVYLGHWLCSEDRAKAIAILMAGGSIATILGAPLSGLLLGVNWLGIAGWRWLFILEGLPAIIFGIITIFYLTDKPQQAKWLSADEREWIINELDKEKQAGKLAHSSSIWEAFKQREIILLSAAYFFLLVGVYGLIFWVPTIVKNLSGFSNFRVTVIAALPAVVSMTSKLILGWSSDRRGERFYHTTIPLLIGGLALLVCSGTQDKLVIVVGMFCIAYACLNSSIPTFWPIATSFLAGSAGAAAVGLINSIGNLGGFVGPFLIGYIKDTTNSFAGGMIFLALTAVSSVVLIFIARPVKKVAQVLINPA